MITRRRTTRRRLRGRAKASRGPKDEPAIKWTLRLPELLDAALTARAKRDGRSKNWMAIKLLQEALAGELQQLEETETESASDDEDDACAF
jgi:hypothetical protein